MGDLTVEDVLHELVVPLGAGPDDCALDAWGVLLVDFASADVHAEEDGVGQSVNLGV